MVLSTPTSSSAAASAWDGLQLPAASRLWSACEQRLCVAAAGLALLLLCLVECLAGVSTYVTSSGVAADSSQAHR